MVAKSKSKLNLKTKTNGKAKKTAPETTLDESQSKKQKSDAIVYKRDIDEGEESSDNDEFTSNEEIGEVVAKVEPGNWVRRNPCTKELRT